MSSRHVRGPLVFNSYKILLTGNYTVLNESVVIVNKTVGAATAITLPAPTAIDGRRVVRVTDAKGDAATNNITVTGASGNINGAANHVISENYGSVDYLDDGTGWVIASAANPLSGAELAFLNGVTAGTGLASKALVLDANGDVTMPDLGSIGFGGVGKISWDTTDANANKLHVQLPAGGGVDVPVIFIGQSIEAVDLVLYDGVVDPRIAMLGVGAVTTGPGLDFRKARGTAASPTVVTSGDDVGTIRGFAAVAAGEYVQTGEIRFDCAGTIATTRGPGTITFLTATDAAPSVLTAGLIISASQDITIGGGAASQSLTFNTSGTDVVLTASSAALAMGAITLNVTGTRFVQSYHTNLTSTNAVTVDSSETVKEAIANYMGDALAFLDRMNIITYRHKQQLDPSGATKLGIRAESVNEPLALDMIDDGSEGQYPGVNLYGLLALATRAIQQLSAKVAALEAAA